MSTHTRIPVILLTGFLGSGKTTFLNQLLQQNPQTRYAVIENELGKQGVDGKTLAYQVDSLTELNSGCLCCSLNDELYQALELLFENRAQFDEVVIEATGIADPAGIAEAFIMQPLVKQHFDLRHIICLIDAEQIEDQLRNTDEAYRQIAFSNVLLLNKTDLVTPNYLDELTQTLQSINPDASLLRRTPELSFVATDYPFHQALPTEANLIKTQDSSFAHPIKHILIPCETDFAIHVLQLTLLMFVNFQAANVYRMKGIVRCNKTQDFYLVQSVGKRLSVEKFVPQAAIEKPFLVFIGRDLKREGLENMLKKAQ
jgi:G3E family GTPase